ncbi:MAG: DUF1464 family protein [Candidatus Altiarchaeia archaeon]
MVTVIGVDPGTKSFDFCGMAGDKVVLSVSVPSEDIAENPLRFVEVIRSIDADYIVGPSGYGLPVKRLSELDKRDLFLLTLVKPEELDGISVLSGMQKSFAILSKEDMPMYFIPGVIHLPTVPVCRKLNKIDMGTADKLCCAVLGIWDQAKRLDTGYDKTSFILSEVGFGYTSAIAVDAGRIVDGIGGTTGSPGYSSLGSMDGELAYLLGNFGKTLLFDGGVSSLFSEKMSPEDLARLKDKNAEYRAAWDCLIEGAVKDVLMLLSSVQKPKEILLSGRLTRIPGVVTELTERLKWIAPVRRVEGITKDVKEAAQGAALVANGLAGGKYTPLVDNLRLREAKGTALDYVRLKEGDELKKKYGII